MGLPGEQRGFGVRLFIDNQLYVNRGSLARALDKVQTKKNHLLVLQRW